MPLNLSLLKCLDSRALYTDQSLGRTFIPMIIVGYLARCHRIILVLVIGGRDYIIP